MTTAEQVEITDPIYFWMRLYNNRLLQRTNYLHSVRTEKMIRNISGGLITFESPQARDEQLNGMKIIRAQQCEHLGQILKNIQYYESKLLPHEQIFPSEN